MSGTTPSLDRQPYPDLRKWLRYWPYEPYSWRQKIAKSGLPGDIQKLLTVVVKKARLMRFEKLEVVDDLVTHFIDGKLAGRSYADLVASFGDVSTTASLIRNSKKRNRPIMFKIAQIFGWGTLALITAYIGVSSYYHAGTPNPTVDYLPEFNAFADNIDDEDRAWPIYRKAWTKFNFVEGGEISRNITGIFYVADRVDENGHQQNRRITPSDAGWNNATAKLDELSELLDSFREGAKKPRMGLALQADQTQYSPEDFAALFPSANSTNSNNRVEPDYASPALNELAENSLVGILLPHVQSFRTAARLLHFDTLYAIEQGDTERVTENLITHFGLARHAADNNTLVGGMVGFAVVGIGMEEIETVIRTPDLLTESQLARIQSAVEDFRPRSLVSFEGEKAMIYDTIQRVFTDDGNGDGRITAQGNSWLRSVINIRSDGWSKQYPEFESLLDVAENLSEPMALFTSETREQTRSRYEAVMEIVKEDFHKPAWEAEMYSWDELLKLVGLSSSRASGSTLRYLLPSGRFIQERVYSTEAAQEATILAIALHRYRLAENEWPNSLEPLLGDYLSEAPVDMVNGSQLNFLIENDTPKIYSVWHDGDDDSNSAPVYQYPDSNNQLTPTRDFSLTNFAYVLRKNDDWTYSGDLQLWPAHSDE